MWAKCGGCCCEEYCVERGSIYADCMGTELPAFYTPTSLPSGGTVGTGGEGTPANCYTLPPIMNYDEDCVYLGLDGAVDYHTEFDADAPEFRIIWDSGPNAGKYMVWIPRENHPEPWCNPITGKTYDPLCTSVFQYSAELSDPPEGCAVDRCLCITPGNPCCEARGFRDTSLPETLSASLEFSCELVSSPGGVETVEFDLVWNTSTSRWEGTAEVCDGTLSVYLRCICTDTESGCDEGGLPCYRVSFDHTGCGENPGTGLFDEGSDSCVCDPFELVFSLSAMTIGCCGAECTGSWELVITE